MQFGPSSRAFWLRGSLRSLQNIAKICVPQRHYTAWNTHDFSHARSSFHHSVPGIDLVADPSKESAIIWILINFCSRYAGRASDNMVRWDENSAELNLLLSQDKKRLAHEQCIFTARSEGHCMSLDIATPYDRRSLSGFPQSSRICPLLKGSSRDIFDLNSNGRRLETSSL